MIRFLVLEDHRIVGAGVASSLEGLGGFECVCLVTTLQSLRSALALLPPGSRPHVVVADIDLGNGDYSLGLPDEFAGTGLPILFLSGHDEPSILRAVVNGGAAGFVHKEASIEELAAAVRAVAAGGTAFSQAILAAARRGPNTPSGREREVLTAIVRGAANKQIGAELGVQERTVETHIRRMLDRYGASNRTELAVLALREGWVRAGGRDA